MDFSALDAIGIQKGMASVAEKDFERSGLRLEKRVVNAQEAFDSIHDPIVKDMFLQQVVKSINSTDLTGLRLVTLIDQVATLANDLCVFTDIIAKNARLRATDYQIRWPEQYVGNDLVEFFNLNGANPAEAQMARGVRTNTCGSYGNTLNIRFITSELAGQSPIMPGDERLRQLQMRLVAMKRFFNANLLSGTEVTAETTAFTPRWGGFIDRSTQYGLVTSGNLTDAIIQGRLDAIANAASVNGIGYQRALIGLTTATQVQAVRSIMISRFGGENSVAFFQTQKDLLAQTLPGLVLPSNMYVVYEPLGPGPTVVFIVEPDLPTASNYCLLFDPTQPMIVDFWMMGMPGPWSVERYTEELTRLYVVFNFQNLCDPLTMSRSVISGLS